MVLTKGPGHVAPRNRSCSDVFRAGALGLQFQGAGRGCADGGRSGGTSACARANSACEKVWREARRNSDFAAVAPYLAEVVSLVRQSADAMAPALGLSPYDALMDGYQRGIGAADVAPVFARYEEFLRDALPRADGLGSMK